jgi:hypothetical protein
MTPNRILPSTCVAALVALILPAGLCSPRLAAMDNVPDPGTSLGDGVPPQPPPQEFQPGGHLGLSGQRQVTIRGLVDLDALIQGNYLGGNSHIGDHRGYGLIRAEMGTKVKLDERVAAVVTFGYYDEAGSAASATSPVTTSPTRATPTVPTDRGRTVLDEGYVDLKEFLGMEQLGITAGRMPVSWNLREGEGAFLYDSRHNDPAVTGWDGARATYNADSVDVDITPYTYRLPDNSTLYGGAVDWKPQRSGSSRTFLTGSINLERNVVLRQVAGNPGGYAHRLMTYYVGAEFEVDEFDISGEYAQQHGDENPYVSSNGTAVQGAKMKGWGANVAIDWRTHLAGGQQFILGGKVDYLSGDDNDSDSVNYAFVNNWTGVNDTYIVESQKYGGLAQYMQGNLEDLKLNAKLSFDEHNRIRMAATYAYFKIPDPQPGAGSRFGQEADLTLTWQYTYNAAFHLFGAVFKPDGGFTNVAPAGVLAKTDPVYLFGLNLGVVF